MGTCPWKTWSNEHHVSYVVKDYGSIYVCITLCMCISVVRI